jgi:hypothetical protein
LRQGVWQGEWQRVLSAGHGCAAICRSISGNDLCWCIWRVFGGCCDPHKPRLLPKSGCTEARLRWCTCLVDRALLSTACVCVCACVCVRASVHCPASFERGGWCAQSCLATAASVVSSGLASARRLKCPWLAVYTPMHRCRVCWELGCGSPCCVAFAVLCATLVFPRRLDDKPPGVTPFLQQGVQQRGTCLLLMFDLRFAVTTGVGLAE